MPPKRRERPRGVSGVVQIDLATVGTFEQMDASVDDPAAQVLIVRPGGERCQTPQKEPGASGVGLAGKRVEDGRENDGPHGPGGRREDLHRHVGILVSGGDQLLDQERSDLAPLLVVEPGRRQGEDSGYEEVCIIRRMGLYLPGAIVGVEEIRQPSWRFVTKASANVCKAGQGMLPMARCN